MNIIKLIYITIFTILISSIDCYAQKPRKIFSYLQENNLNLALEEYAKIKSDKVYDADKKLLFEIANCIFLIDKTYSNYNPIESINHFNRIYFDGMIIYAIEDKDEIIKFLSKYDLTLKKIFTNIHAEIVNEAKKINTIESYDKALEVCTYNYRHELSQLKEEVAYKKTLQEASITSYKSFIQNYNLSNHKDEIKSLLERKVLDNAKSNQSVDDLNSFLVEYKSSNLKQEATDFRDSIVLSKVPNNYDAMLAFTNEYANSIYTNNVKLKLGDLLFERIEINGLINDYQLFIDLYKQHYRFTEINEKLQNLERLIYKNAVDSNTYSSLKYYLDKFPNGVYRDTITNILNYYYRIINDLYLTNGEVIIHENGDSGDNYDIKKDWDKDGINDIIYRVVKKTLNPNYETEHFEYENFLVYYLSSTKRLNKIPSYDNKDIFLSFNNNNQEILVISESCGVGRCSVDYFITYSNEFKDFRFIEYINTNWHTAEFSYEFEFDILNDVINISSSTNKKQSHKLYLNYPKFLLSNGFSEFSELANHFYSLSE